MEGITAAGDPIIRVLDTPTIKLVGAHLVAVYICMYYVIASYPIVLPPQN